MPNGTVNFITAHDGFTLRDLTSYNEKHNLANGENNADGTPDNRSYNHGVEGETEDPYILEARMRAARNMMTILLISSGTVMTSFGDEVLRTQGGNNNAYNQDNTTSWVPWGSLSTSQLQFKKYMSGLIHYRLAHPQFHASKVPKTRFIHANESQPGDYEWLTRHGVPMEYDEQWNDFVIGSFRKGEKFKVDDSLTIHNVGHESVDFALPTDRRFKGKFSKVADVQNGEIYRDSNEEKIIQDGFITVAGLTSVVLSRRNG